MFSHFRIVLISTIISTFAFSTDMWINEFHYDDPGSDSNEGVEVIISSDFTDLANVTVSLYNGSSSQRNVYDSETLDNFIVGETVNGFTVYSTTTMGSLQNGAPDGLSLDNAGTLVSFLCYEGTFEAASGPAQGQTCIDVGVEESGSSSCATCEDQSIQLVGTGSSSSDFTWQVLEMYTFGSLNTGQTLETSGGGDVTCNDETACNNGASEACTYAADACTACDGTNLGGQDDCGVCGGDNSTCADCCGVPNGNGSTCDGVCGACNDATSCLDCEGTVNGTVTFDSYGLCGGDGTAVANLFFSEHAEGSSNNKYFEIYNASSVTVSLDSYEFLNCSNGCTDWEYTNTFASGATVAAGDVYAVCHSSFAGDLSLCDETRTLYHTGNDAQGLRHVASGAYLDLFGEIATSGSNWTVCGELNATAEHTLVRKSSVATGNDDWAASAGTTADDCEWIVNPQNYWNDLGSHTYAPVTDVAGCMDSNATNYDSNATTQTYNEYGTSTCTYASCSDIPDGDPNVEGAQGCLWVDGTSSMMWNVVNGVQVGLAWWECPTVCGLVEVNFELDLADDVTGTTPHVNGNYNGWCGSCYNDMSDSDGDGIWNHTQYFTSGQFVEYKFSMDGWSLAETDYAGTPLGSCFNEYTNRSFTAGDINTSMTLASCFGSCDATCSSSDDGGTDGGSTPTCDDGVQNQDETGIDCGGSSCAACATAGCMDMNASNYDSTATVDAYDGNGNLLCVYNSDCSNVPDDGCVYPESFGAWSQWFNWQDCYNYGGTPCAVGGCMDSGADNYDATATEQSYDSYGNQLCTYSSCDDVPQDGCIYAGVHSNYDPLPSYAPFNDGDDGIAGTDDDFDAEECQLWGTACVTAPATQPDNLFFSEYGEGSSNNKYWELYNATNAAVDLADYAYVRCSNACTDYEYTDSFTDGATIAAGDVYVVCHSSSDPLILAECDQTTTYISNGDDALGLLHVSSNTLLDKIGTPGDGSSDPLWDVAGVTGATANKTLVRKNTVTQGNTDWAASAGTTEENSEWVVLDSNTWTFLGSHPHSFDATCNDETACNYLESGDCVFANTGEDCDGNTLYTLTFSVNMTYADIDTTNGVRVFGSWGTAWTSDDAVSATCDENDVCTASITLPAGDYLYKFRNGWSYENVDDLSCAALDDPDGDGFGYWNRTVTISGDETLDTVCFGVCADCIGGCLDSNASNYDANAGANVDDGSCEYLFPSANLFFSEYTEGSGNNKYLEIYNASSETVLLSSYAYPSTANAPAVDGEHEYWNTFDAGAQVAAGDVYVICHGSADDLIQVECNESHNYLSNGDDGYCLVYGSEADYEVLDCIGDFNGDPGSGWDVAGVTAATKDHTLVRKSDVTTGNDGYWEASAGTEDDDSEWHVIDMNHWDFLGSHPHTLVYGCTDAAANNTTDGANVDDGSCTYPLLLTLEACSSASSVRMTGPWWGWDPNGGPVAADNGDGSWTVTFDPAPGDNMEYLWVVDGVQENLLSSDFTCTPITDNWSYANRQWTVGSGNGTDVYGTCASECQYTVSFTADMNCADYTPVSGDVVHVQGMNTGWGSVFTDLSDDDGDGVWTGSGSISAGTWEWKLSVGHWNNDTQTWNAWEAQEELANLSDCASTSDGTHWNRVTVVTDSDVSESVTYGSCTACASCSDLTCESWESCSDVAYTAPSCECAGGDGNVNGAGDINVTDIVAMVGWILVCEGNNDCFTAEQVCRGDLTGDGLVNIIDVTALINIILADRVSYDDATSANIVLSNNTIAINSDGHVAGVQMTLSHGSNFSLDLVDSYVSEYKTVGNRTTLILATIDNSLEEIATYKGSFEVESIILCNSSNEISDVNIINVNSIEVKLAGPNPFNPSTSLNIVVAQDGYVSVNVYNLVGQKVATLLDGYMNTNLNGYPVNFNGSNLASGVYLVRAETAGNVSTQKLMLLK